MSQNVLPLMVTLLMGAGDANAMMIEDSRQLFLDDALIATRQNVARTIHPARKFSGNPVLWPEEPWEGKLAIIYGSVIRDGDTYRMWYHGGPGVSYAESPDGITWTKPRLGLFEIDGHDTNVVIRRGAEDSEPNTLPHFYEIFGVHKSGAAGEDRRYVMGYLSIQRDYSGPRADPFHGNQRRGLGVATSPDGIHWTLADSWATDAICDGATHWMLDPKTNRYVLYGRTKYVSEEVKAAWAGNDWVQRMFWGRSVARVESPDFLQWDYSDPATAPVVMTPDLEDTPGDEIYSMEVFPYESVYIGLVQVFHNQPDACHLDLQLAVSRDSVRFTRVGDRTPFIPCGPVGSWDRFNNSPANNPPIAVGDELRFYYGGRTYRHSPYDGPDKGESGGGVGFATVKRDRFVSLDASFDAGVIESVPVRLASANLHLNAQCPYGEILVEAIATGNDNPEVVAASEPIRADSLDIPVRWARLDPAKLAEPVVLRITLKNARLFALWSTTS